ncbi:ATP-binding protein [Reichenbachiella agariperforans]|uniref:ATP-binding protein n=1 Tax=Reichenbachiella agariperforans TaxID=156994 RepID=UPI001C090257|nr:ATP-binding protein [Reichenbachiella agariperforans]MBU2912700.1 ATP-binding protein [Reichenbachiella agariperforans]
MKTVNLISLVEAKNGLKIDLFHKYLKKYGIDLIKESELQDFETFILELFKYNQSMTLFEGYFIGFTIPQISKEFDLLRVGQKSIINIEIKKKNTGHRIQKQLTENQYYLSFLGKEIFSFTYIVEENKLFQLASKNELQEINFNHLVSCIHKQKIESITSLDALFNPSNYLVSPFNSTEKFISRQYFLTDHQEKIKREIFELINKTPSFFSIRGNAGTGKTLLTYDIAMELMTYSQNVFIIHCGILNDGQKLLIDNYGWNIVSIKDHLKVLDAKLSVVIVDEAQRIKEDQLRLLIDHVKKVNVSCIFSYDQTQCLSDKELLVDASSIIKSECGEKDFGLTTKIRTNKEIATFIRSLFDKSRPGYTKNSDKIEISYFQHTANAIVYLEVLRQNGWKVINYTKQKYGLLYLFETYNLENEENAHHVIGQEFDKVVAVIDKHFVYENDILVAKHSKKPIYNQHKMLLQIVTRTRQKLHIVIVDNCEILERCLEIL